MTKRSIMFLLVLAAAAGLFQYGIKAGVIAAAGGVAAAIMIFCIAGVIDALLAAVGAQSALADKILIGIGLIKEK